MPAKPIKHRDMGCEYHFRIPKLYFLLAALIIFSVQLYHFSTLFTNIILLQKLQHGAEQLSKLEYRRDAVGIMKEHAGILQKLAQANSDTQQKHSYYLKVCLS